MAIAFAGNLQQGLDSGQAEGGQAGKTAAGNEMAKAGANSQGKVSQGNVAKQMFAELGLETPRAAAERWRQEQLSDVLTTSYQKSIAAQYQVAFFVEPVTATVGALIMLGVIAGELILAAWSAIKGQEVRTPGFDQGWGGPPISPGR